MSFQFLTLVEPHFMASSQTTVYTAGVGTQARIDSLSITNTDTAAVTISINLVPSGGSASSANLTTKAQSIQPAQTWNCPNEIGKVLSAGDFMSVISSTSSVAVISCGGILQF